MNATINRSSSNFKFASVLILAISIITTFAGVAVAQNDKDSATVLALVEKYQKAWDTHDQSAVAAFFTEDADFIMGNQPLLNGRKEIMNWWGNYFKRQEPGRKLKIEVNSVRILTNDVAIINVSTTTWGVDDKGKELLSRKARGTWVLLWRDGNWFISSMRGMPTEEDLIIRASDH